MVNINGIMVVFKVNVRMPLLPLPVKISSGCRTPVWYLALGFVTPALGLVCYCLWI